MDNVEVIDNRGEESTDVKTFLRIDKETYEEQYYSLVEKWSGDKIIMIEELKKEIIKIWFVIRKTLEMMYEVIVSKLLWEAEIERRFTIYYNLWSDIESNTVSEIIHINRSKLYIITTKEGTKIVLNTEDQLNDTAAISINDYYRQNIKKIIHMVTISFITTTILDFLTGNSIQKILKIVL